MHLSLTATGSDSKQELYRLEVDGSGAWTYRSRAVEGVRGQLRLGDVEQLRGLYEAVDWEKHVLNAPVSADDRIHFRLGVQTPQGEERTYMFSEAVTHASFQFRDLVHFLRHNVAIAGEPVGPGLVPQEGDRPAPPPH